MDQIAYLMRERRRAQLAGDAALVRSWDAQLARHGVFPEPDRGPMETTQAEAMPERAVPPQPKRRGRKPQRRTSR